jgi:pimeloyl-ACP methyl ester carboxylesterase
MSRRFHASVLVTLIFCATSVVWLSPASARATCDAATVEPQTLVAADGTRIAAFVQGSASTAIVLVHQVNQDHCGWANQAAALSNKYRVMSIDLRGYGSSDAPKGANALDYKADVEAAVVSLRAAGAKKIVIVGASMGASAVVVAATTINPPVDGVVAVSAPTNFKGQNALAAAPKLTVPARFIAAKDDASAAAAATRLSAAAKKSPDHAAVILAKGGHGWTLLRVGSPAEQSMITFIDER